MPAMFEKYLLNMDYVYLDIKEKKLQTGDRNLRTSYAPHGKILMVIINLLKSKPSVRKVMWHSVRCLWLQ